MDWLQFFASIAGSLAWPAAVVIIVAMMRKPVAGLIPFVRTLKYKDLQIDLGEQLEAVKEKVEASGQSKEPEEPQPVYLELARIDPRAAVLSAWVPVELAIKDLAMKRGAMTVGAPIAALTKRLHAAGEFDDTTYEALAKLRAIRNEAAHLMLVSYDEAISMGEMCEWAVGQLKAAGAEV